MTETATEPEVSGNKKAARGGTEAAQDLNESLITDSISSVDITQEVPRQKPENIPQPNHLAFKPRKGSAAYVEMTKVASTKKAMNSIGAYWRGGKFDEIAQQWENSGRDYRSIELEKKEVLFITLEKLKLDRNEIDFFKTYEPPKRLKKAARVANEVAEHRRDADKLKATIAKKIHHLEVLHGTGEIDAEELERRKKEVTDELQPKIDELILIANKKEESEFKILEEGIEKGESAGSFIIEPGKTHLAAKRAKEILSNHECGVFQRIGQTVRIVKYVTTPKAKKSTVDRPNGAFFIATADEPFLVQLLSKKASWARFDKRTKNNEPIDFPEKAARFVLSDRGSGLPVLSGFVCAPTLREDGSVLYTPGYDPESGLFFDPCGTTFPSIPNNPSKEDAAEALSFLKDLLKDFRFDGEVSHSVALAEIMTGVVRRSLEYAPAFGNNAPEAGSGKSLLGDVAAIIATGNRCTCVSPANNEEENRKRLASALLGGDLVVCVDNVQDPYESESMCTILTSQHWQERLLGTNTNAQIPTNSLFIFTGNNLTFLGDMCSRVVICSIDPQTERPGERIFDRDLRKYAAEYRGALVAAVLTIIRAYIVAGCPDQSISPFRLFSEWTRWIRSPLVWLGMDDPYESTRLVTDNDPARAELGTLFAAWHAVVKPLATYSITINRLIEIATNPGERPKNEDVDALYGILRTFARDKGSGIDARVFGNKIRQCKGRRVGGFLLEESGKDRNKVVLWKVTETSKNAGSAGSAGTVSGQRGEMAENRFMMSI